MSGISALRMLPLHHRSRSGDLKSGPRARRGGSLRPAGVIGFSIGAGLITGVCELVLQEARRRLFDGTALGALHLNQHAWWMTPLSLAAILGCAGLVAAMAAGLARARWPLVVGLAVVCFAAAFSLLLVYRGLSNLAYATLALGLALQLAPGAILLARQPRLLAQVGLAATAAAGAALLLLPGGRDQPPIESTKPAPAGAPNVVLIVLDTVRAQSLGIHGRRRPTSPQLRALAKRGTRFDQARTPAAWTLPAHAAMFTGHWAFELSARLDRPLDDRQPTLAEYLAQHGYETAGFVANTMFGSSYFGLDRGFEHYEDVAVTPVEFARSSLLGRFLLRSCVPALAARDRPKTYFYRKDAAEVNESVLEWLDDRPRDRPFFAFLNYFDAHDPYVPPEPAPARFGAGPRSAHDLEILHDWHRIDKTLQPKRIVALARDRYEECVAALDSELGRLVDQLEARGLLEKTIVIVTSDHGELLGEHGLFGHGQSLHSQVTRVPLVVVAPGQAPAGRVVTEPVSLTDLPATIAGLAGLADQAPFPGRSLDRFWGTNLAADDEDDESILLSETVDDEDSDHPSLIQTRSLIHEGKVYLRGKDGREQVFDLATDPREKHDLSADPAVKPLLERFRAMMQRVDERARASLIATELAGNSAP